MGAATLAPGS
ncbi:hypothetical protein BN1708_019580, partial [Verticillium longisporum]